MKKNTVMETKLFSGNITLHFLLCKYLKRSNLKLVVNLDNGQKVENFIQIGQMRFDLENEKIKQKGKEKEKRR